MLPGSMPHFSLGPFFALASSAVMVILCFITLLFYPRYRPLKGLLLFYLFLALCFLGWVIYGLQKSPESILWGYRVDYAAMALLPASWLWFYLALLNRKQGWLTWTLTGISIFLAGLALFGKGSYFFSLPFEPDPITAEIWRPQSKLLRILIQSFGLAACLVYFLHVTLRFWRAKEHRPIYLLPISIGLLLFFLGGLNDALRSKGLAVFNEQIFWLASSWLSIFFAIAITLHFRSLERDLSEARKARVDALENSRKELQHLNRAKSKALDHLSHELRTPLSVIQGNIRLLQNKLRSQISFTAEEERTFEALKRHLTRLQEIQRETDRIIRSHNEVEAASQMERLDPEPSGDFEIISLYPFTERVLEKVKRNAAHRDIQIHLEGTKDLTLSMDPAVLEDVLEGLMRNAIENTPDEGIIKVVLEQKGQWLLLRVQDFGIGITKENQRHLFDGLFHTQETELYSSGTPYHFGAGGKGLSLLRIKTYGQRFGFEILVGSQRCIHLPTDRDICPGRISACPHCASPQDCLSSGGSTFCFSFPMPRTEEPS
jgi:signal transduction histidine kinase